jgi:hypothetical protein
MLRVENFLVDTEESDDRYISYHLSERMPIFNSLVDNEELFINVSRSIKLEMILNEVGNYLIWLTQCENELKTFFESELQDKVNDTWFKEIEVYRVNITFNSENDYGATISCGDPLFIDHTLEIDFDCKTIDGIRLIG